jgi:ribosomal-protein-alanine N-acetyltransferase
MVRIIPEIETDRMMLRQATTGHLNDWAARIFADPEVMRYLPKRDMTPYARAERALNNYNRLWEERHLGGWVLTEKSTSQLIGHCHVTYLDETDEYELGYSLSKECWGKGFATEAARAATLFSFESRGLQRLMALTLPENTPSRRVLERVGFIYEKDAHYYDLDVVYYALPRERFHTGNSAYRAYE